MLSRMTVIIIYTSICLNNIEIAKIFKEIELLTTRRLNNRVSVLTSPVTTTNQRSTSTLDPCCCPRLDWPRLPPSLPLLPDQSSYVINQQIKSLQISSPSSVPGAPRRRPDLRHKSIRINN